MPVALVVLVAAGAAIFFLVRSSGDGLGGVRGQDAVAEAELRGSNTVVVKLEPGADRAGVLAALDELPEEARFVNVKLGRVDLDLDRARGETRAALVDQLLALATVRAPAISIEISRRSGIDARVKELAQAAPLVLEIAERIASQPTPGVESNLRVEQLPSSRPGSSALFLELQRGRATETALAAVRASQALGEREPRVSGGRNKTQLRVQADSLADAADAWQETGRALEASGADAELVEVYVDRRRPEGKTTSPMLSGLASQDPDRALALVGKLDGVGTAGFATAELSFARVVAGGAGDARTATEAAQATGVKRFSVAWTSAKSDPEWLALTVGISRVQTSVDDDPAVGSELLDGAARARTGGIRALHWDRQAQDGVPRLRVARPTWLPIDTVLTENPNQLRRLMRAIRSVGWPGVAKFDVITGPGECSNGSSVVRITSTSNGAARKAEGTSSCTDEAVIEPVRRAWDSAR